MMTSICFWLFFSVFGLCEGTVIPLVEGIMYPIERGFVMTASVTLVIDDGFAMIVDSPSAADRTAKTQMFGVLESLRIRPEQIHFAVTTHGHPDHFGAHSLFPNAHHFFGPYEYSGSEFRRNELFDRNEIRLTKNIELWNTPGHTSQDISVIIREVNRTVAVVGDLFYSELDALSDGLEWSRDSWNAQLGAENRRKVVCAADAIVPGHSAMFRVNSEMRLHFGCSDAILPVANELPLFRRHSDESRPKPRERTVSNSPPERIPQSLPAERLAQPSVADEHIQSAAILLPLNSKTLLNQLILPLFDSSNSQLANYLSAASPGAPIPMPQLPNAQVRTYPTILPLQLIRKFTGC